MKYNKSSSLDYFFIKIKSLLASLRFNLYVNQSIATRVVFAITLLFALFLAGAFARFYLFKPKPSTYITAKVTRGDIENAILTTGSLQAKQQVDVGARVSGQLKSLKVRLGDQVEKGQLLAEIDPQLSENAFRSAEASLEGLAAQRRAIAASLLQAELSLKRQHKMITNNATSLQEVEIAEAQLQVQRANLASYDAQIKQAKTQVDSALANLDYTKITAPMSGIVVAIVTQEGQTVVAAQQAPVILKLANLDVMTVKAMISEADVIKIKKGQASYFTILGASDVPHSGHIDTIEPAPQDFSETGVKTAGPVFYNALFNAANADHQMRIGMTAQVTVVLREARNVLTVPLYALGAVSADGRYALRVLSKIGRISTVMVRTGIDDSVRVHVLDGVKEGDDIVTQEFVGTESSPR